MFGSLGTEGQVIDYGHLQGHLLDQGLEATPSEVHGVLSGQLAAGADTSGEAALWGLSRSRDVTVHGDLAGAIMRMYAVIAGALEDENLDFHPLLPPDDTAIELRAEEMGRWCSGFLAGFANGLSLRPGGATDPGVVPGGEEQEILEDFAAIARAEAEAGAPEEELEEELEESYTELYEYLRMATLNLYLLSRDAQPEAPQPGTVH